MTAPVVRDYKISCSEINSDQDIGGVLLIGHPQTTQVLDAAIQAALSDDAATNFKLVEILLCAAGAFELDSLETYDPANPAEQQLYTTLSAAPGVCWVVYRKFKPQGNNMAITTTRISANYIYTGGIGFSQC